MSGMKQTPEAAIAELRNLLNEQYVASSVLKELIQNADDSRARSIVICSHPGIEEPAHPLLEFPALLVINDGTYAHKDYEAIPYKGVGAKGDNKEAVGKFGQGLKSVFHLCEAFFFLGSQNQEAMSAHEYDPILNPWHGSKHHLNWCGCDNRKVVAQISEAIARVTPELDQWFCLWIPLRTAELHGSTSPISHSYPLADEICTVTNAPQIAAIMPMLKELSFVHVKQVLRSAEITNQFSLVREPNSESRTVYRSPNRKVGQSEFGGTIVFSKQGETSWTYRWHATEELANLPELTELKGDPKWPEIASIDENGETATRKDKADQHVAVVFGKFTDCSGVQPGLSITDAVFLPLNIKDTMVWPSALTLMMHGYFFIDSGRNALVKAPESGQSRVKYEWNERLRQRLQFPLLLQALDNAYRVLGLTGDELANIVEQITKQFRDDIKYVCNTWSWLPVLQPDGVNVQWRLISRTEHFYEVPKPSDRLVAFILIPALADVATSKLLVQQGYPRLTANTPASLLPEFPRLIASMQEKWKEESGRKYVIEGDGLTLLGTMLTAYQPLDESTKRALASYMRAVLAQIDFKDQQTQLNMLAELLSPEQKLGIPEEVADSLGVNFRSLADNLKPRVAIPTVNTTNIQLTDEEADLLLAWSASRNLSDRGHWLLGGFVNDSLFNCGLHAAALSRTCWKAKCFPVKINNRREMFSLSDVRASLSMNRLIKSPIFQEVELLKALTEAVPRLHCVIVPNNVDDALAKLRLDKVPRCNEDFVFNFLSSQPDLKSLDNRLPLLKSLLKGDEWRGYTHAIRYLLHGSKEDTGVDPLFDVTGEREDESKVFSKVMIHILLQKDQAWRVVNETVLKSLSGDQKDELRIGKMDTAQLEREICGNVDSLQSLTLNEDERTILLRSFLQRNRLRVRPGIGCHITNRSMVPWYPFKMLRKHS